MESPERRLPDSELAGRIAKLWPHREHESNSVLGLLCRIDLHSWRRLDLASLVLTRTFSIASGAQKLKLMELFMTFSVSEN